MNKMRVILLLIIPALLLSASCSLAGNNAAAADVSYSSKEVQIYSYIDNEKSILELSEDLFYSANGELSAKDVYVYEEQGDGQYLNTIIKNYDYTDGEPVLSGKLEYDYFQDYYDGATAYDWIAYRETAYTYSDGTYSLEGYTEVCYDGQACGDADSDTSSFANYTSFIEYDSTGSAVETQTCTWMTLSDGYQYYQRECYYDGDEDGANLIEEYVCHYDELTYNYTYEMCHFVNEGEADDYFYTLYSRNLEDQVYEQSDYDYAVVSGTDVDAVYGMFLDTDLADTDDMTQNIVLENIGSKQTVVLSEYNPYGSRIKKTMSSQGEIISLTYFSYDQDDNLTDTSSYENGGDYLSERETVCYSEEQDNNGEYQWIETTCTYNYDDNDRSIDNTRGARGVVNKLQSHGENKLKENHRI